MHIKQITISNFRSFRQQPEIQPFSPSTNTIVGRNGSGKSNLFDAVQFCLLAPRFVNLRQEERQALLHEGSGSAAVNAYVEIVFDNTDHRFQLENSDEVVLRRTVGLKKDEFFLQRKRATKSEIQSLLEGAGFSKSNPYYVVQQGKVQDLCIMSDSNRLRLLKEVAGTTLYDEKKSESLSKMEENALSIAKITEILNDIENRLDELQQEKDELSAYQQADRSRRAAEYCLYDKELRKARSQLDAVEHERSDHAESISELHDSLKENHDSIRHVETILTTKSNATKRNRSQLQNLEQDNKKAVQNATRLQLECESLEEQIQGYVEQEARNQEHLEQVVQQIQEAESELANTAQPQYDQAVSELQQFNDEIDSCIRQTEALYAKQSRGREFATKKQRDAFLKNQMKEIQNLRNEKHEELSTSQDTLSSLRKTVEKETATVTKLQQDILEHNNTLQTLQKTLNEKKRQRLELHESRNDGWRKTEESQEQVRETKEALNNAIGDLKKVMPRATSMGLDKLPGIVQAERLVRGQHFFGTLMENMELKDEKYQTAVEVAAQNSLFHVIVDTDHTAARLMNRLEKGKLGRVTFLPLSQLRIDDNIRYPDSNDVKPMLDLCIQYDPKVERAMQHVFQKKMIARTPEIASEWSTRLSMDVITLDGDLCSRKGALTGGFVDVTKSRLGAQARLKESQETLQRIQLEHQTLKSKAQEVDQEVTNLMQEIQRLEAKLAELNRMVDKKETEIDRLQKRNEKHKKNIEEFEKVVIPALEREVALCDVDIERLKAEIGTELQENLSDEERELLSSLKERQSILTKEIVRQKDKVSAASMKRQKLVSLLEDNLFKRRTELQEGTVNVPDDDEDDALPTRSGRRSSSSRRTRLVSLASLKQQLAEDLEERRRELEIAQKLRDDIDRRLEEARATEAELLGEFNQAKNELETLKNQSMKLTKEMEDFQDKSERLLNKRSMCISKRETYVRKIQELGSLPPPSELEKFESKSIQDLMKSLESINKKLKKYSHVNKKAFDQYVNFSEQRESLLKRKEELDQGAEKVRELIESLDRQKDEAINRTFRGVSAHFKDVFNELVPNGAGELIMRTSIDMPKSASPRKSKKGTSPSKDSTSNELSASQTSASSNNPDVSLYEGIGIKVRFSAVGENFMMSQLSGGQKALVALALIFAIQRCDPAPFYLFDELDQALDSTYRASVASLIHRQATSAENPTQFIVSTFRQELVSVANRCFGISHQNKVSSLHHLTKNDAQSFIANLMSEEEAVGQVSSIAPSSSTVRQQSVTKDKFNTTSTDTTRKRKASLSSSNDPAVSDSVDPNNENNNPQEQQMIDAGDVSVSVA